MIEGYDAEGRTVLLNPYHVVESYSNGGDAYDAWCNVTMINGTTHRFKGETARRVFAALLAATLKPRE